MATMLVSSAASPTTSAPTPARGRSGRRGGGFKSPLTRLMKPQSEPDFVVHRLWRQTGRPHTDHTRFSLSASDGPARGGTERYPTTRARIAPARGARPSADAARTPSRDPPPPAVEVGGAVARTGDPGDLCVLATGRREVIIEPL